MKRFISKDKRDFHITNLNKFNSIPCITYTDFFQSFSYFFM